MVINGNVISDIDVLLMPLIFWHEKHCPSLIAKEEITKLLLNHNIEVFISVRETNMEDDLAYAERFRDMGIDTGIWPLLRESDGYWINILNAPKFREYVESIISLIDERGIDIRYLAVDLEPPLWLFKKIRTSKSCLLDIIKYLKLCILSYYKNIDALNEAISIIRHAGIKVILTVPDFLFEFDKNLNDALSRALGIPLDEIEFDYLSTMTYNSIMAGYFKVPLKLLRYRMMIIMKKCVRMFGEGYIPSLGALGRGKLGDAPIYSRPEQIADDISIAKAAGAKRVIIYSLEGLLRKKRPQDWIIKMEKAKPRKPPVYIKYQLDKKFLEIHINKLLKIIGLV